MHKVSSVSLKISLLAFAYLFSTNSKSLAQVTTDGTVNTQVNQNGNNAEITGGETRGNNLFHSFQDFSVPTGNEAFFNNANDISNIFSRVTGGNISNIDGLIRANDANLFLINPAGILFGAGARLDLGGGSFYGSSADSILFEDGEFSATDLDNPPLLTVNAPIGLGFRDNPGEITNRSTADGVGLQVLPGETIGLIGGNINLEGGLITAPGGKIELGGLTEAGVIDLADDGSFSFPNDVVLSNVFLSNNAEVDITSGGGGLILVNANNLELTEASQFLANIGEGLGSETAVAGTIQINSTSLSASDNSLIHSDNLGIGQAGTINIITDTFNFAGGSAITATTFGVGDAGTINITAQDIAIDQEFSGIYSNVGLTRIASDEQNTAGVVGNGGVINIDTDTLSLTNGARITSTSIAQGNGGIININATGAVSYIGQGVTPVPAFNGGVVISGSFSQLQQDGVGNSGDVNITADSLTLIDKGAVLANNSAAEGDAGEITLDIQNNIFLDQGALILAQVRSRDGGNGGDINITAGSFEAQGGSFILADTKTIGNAGDINIDVEETISLDGESTLILTEVGDNGMGDAGNINITGGSLIVQNSADIISQTKAKGDAGDINIDVEETISLDGENTLILTQVSDNAEGNAGNINITGGSLVVQNSANINAQTNAKGDAGDINIDVEETISLDGENTLILTQVSDNAEGDAGNINITGGSLAVQNSADINAQTNAEGDAGDIVITTNDSISLDNNGEIRSLVENEAMGNGGNISLVSGELNITNNSQIVADTTGQGTGEGNISEAGDININVTGDVNLDNNSKIQSQTKDGAVGNAGNITIKADGSLFSTNGNLILADTQATGDGGNIKIEVGNTILLEGIPEGGFPSQIVAGLTSEESNGAGGTIDIKANELVLEDVAFISSNTTANSIGEAGNITLNVDNLNISENAFINVLTANESSGGTITVNSQTLDLASGGKILAATDGGGNAGNINLNVNDEIKINNSLESSAGDVDFGEGAQLLNDLQNSPSGIYANATENSTGSGGNVNIGRLPEQVTDNFVISDNAQIVVSSEGLGNGGNIFLNSKILDLDNNASISALTNSGQGGEITLQIAENLTLDNNSSISAQALNDGNGGNINIDTNFIVAFPNGNNDIIANAERGNGGNITINAESLFGIEERPLNPLTNDINASSEFSLDGSVTINTPDLNSFQGETDLPQNIITSDQTTAQACSGNRGSIARNSFTIKGKGGIPVEPGLPLNSQNIFITGESSNSISATPQGIETSQGKIQPARGIKVTESGKIVLTAYRTNNSGERILEIQQNCG